MTNFSIDLTRFLNHPPARNWLTERRGLLSLRPISQLPAKLDLRMGTLAVCEKLGSYAGIREESQGARDYRAKGRLSDLKIFYERERAWLEVPDFLNIPESQIPSWLALRSEEPRIDAAVRFIGRVAPLIAFKSVSLGQFKQKVESLKDQDWYQAASLLSWIATGVTALGEEGKRAPFLFFGEEIKRLFPNDFDERVNWVRHFIEYLIGNEAMGIFKRFSYPDRICSQGGQIAEAVGALSRASDLGKEDKKLAVLSGEKLYSSDTAQLIEFLTTAEGWFKSHSRKIDLLKIRAQELPMGSNGQFEFLVSVLRHETGTGPEDTSTLTRQLECLIELAGRIFGDNNDLLSKLIVFYALKIPGPNAREQFLSLVQAKKIKVPAEPE